MVRNPIKGRTGSGNMNPPTVCAEDRIMIRAANPRTGVISPSHTGSSQDEAIPHQRSTKQWRLRGDQWVSVDIDHPTSSKTLRAIGNTSQDAPQGRSLHVPIPGQPSNGWEDRFVLNMPHAREPNLPTMTHEQIMNFQSNMEKDHREHGAIMNPEGSHNPQAVAPRNYGIPPSRRPEDGSSSDKMDQPPRTPSDHSQPYFCPDDVGRDQVSPILNISRPWLRESQYSIKPGSHITYKQIFWPIPESMDEGSLIPTVNNYRRPLTLNKTKEEESVVIRGGTLQEKAIIQGGQMSSQSMRTSPCLKQRIINQSQESRLHISPKQTGMLTIDSPSLSPLKQKPDLTILEKENQAEEIKNGDDVFIITPIMIPTTIPRSSTPHLQLLCHQERRKLSTSELESRCANFSVRFGSESETSMNPVNALIQDMHTPNHEDGSHWKSEDTSATLHMPKMNLSQSKAGDTPDKHRYPIRWRFNPAGNKCLRKLNIETIFQNLPWIGESRDRQVTPKGNKDRNSRDIDISKLHNLLLEGCYTNRTESQRAQYSPDRNSRNKLLGGKRETNMQVHDNSNEDGVPGSNHSSTDSIINTSFLGLYLLIDLFLLCFSRLQAASVERNQMLHHFIPALRRLHAMAKRCLQLSGRILYACFVYWRTGLWPRYSKEELALLMQDIGRAAISFIVLVIVLSIIGKVAECVVLVASWVVWLSKPFTWLFGRAGDILLDCLLWITKMRINSRSLYIPMYSSNVYY